MHQNLRNPSCLILRHTHIWTTQIGRSFCLFGKRRLFAVGGVFSFPGSVLVKIKFCAKTRSRKSAEFGGKSAEFGGKSAEFHGSRFQHVGVLVAFRRFFSRAAFFGLSSINFCRRGRQKVLPPEGPGMFWGPFVNPSYRCRISIHFPVGPRLMLCPKRRSRN